MLASRIAEKGVVITISAGNSGDAGPFYGSSGSSGDNVLAVASVDPNVQAAEPLKVTFSKEESSNTTTVAFMTLKYFVTNPIMPVKVIKFTNSRPDEYYCDPLPADTPDLSGYTILTDFSSCESYLWMTDLMDHGAKSILTYDNVTFDMYGPWFWHWGLQVGMVEAKVGEYMENAIKGGVNVTVEFLENSGYNVTASNVVGGTPSSYTTWGGLYDLRIKPDIAAPGGRILSSVPGNAWMIASGTSMSCPYVAGIAALYISKFGGRSIHGSGFGKQLVDTIISSGTPMSWPFFDGMYPHPTGWLAPVPQIGNGLVNAWKVLNTKTHLAFDKFHLNDTHQFSRYHGIDITNNNDVEVTYSFALQPAGGFEAQSPTRSYELATFDQLSPIDMVPKVKMPSGTQKLKPGQTKRVEYVGRLILSVLKTDMT
jgi:hypothetical protein